MIYAIRLCAIYHWYESQPQLHCVALRGLTSNYVINFITILINILSEENVSGAYKCKTYHHISNVWVMLGLSLFIFCFLAFSFSLAFYLTGQCQGWF